MGLLQFLLVAGCVAVETFEHIFYRLGSRDKKKKLLFVALGASLHICGLSLWYLLLDHLQLGVAAPLVGSAGYVTIALAGAILFGEGVSRRRWAGIGIIMFGLCLIAAYGGSGVLDR